MRNAEWPDEGRSPCRASIDIPHSAFRNPHLIFMHRVLIISHTYLPPSNRGKLRALAARGLEVTVGVPQRWRDAVLGRTLEVAWERQNGVEVFPLPARHHGDAATLTFGSRALHALLRDKRPDLIQVEEEPTVPAARQVVRAARQLKLPAVLFTHQNVAVPLPWLGGWRRNRTLRRLRGAIAGARERRRWCAGSCRGCGSGSSPSSGSTCRPSPSMSITTVSRSDAWAVWSPRRESILCCRRWRRTAPIAGT